MRRDDFSPRSHRAVSLQILLSSETAKAEATVAIVYPVEPYGKWMSLSSSDWSWSLMMISMKKTLFSLSAALPFNPFHSKEISDIGIMNEYFVSSTFRRHLDSLPSNSIKFVFPYLSRCSAVIQNDIATVATLSFLDRWGIFENLV